MNKKKQSIFSLDNFWQMVCFASIIGIWPNLIEPNYLTTTKLKLQLNHKNKSLKGLKILQISDLHINDKTSKKFLTKIINSIQKIKPDIILLTGDFLLYAKTDSNNRLLNFLKQLKAPFGCYCSLGNHDYEKYTTITQQGEIEHTSTKSYTKAIFNALLKKQKTPKYNTLNLKPNSDLLNILSKTRFCLLQNETKIISIKNTFLNICGLGDLWAGDFNPKKAFSNYDSKYHGIVLSHNPDSFKMLQNYYGEIILSGHTHGGGQVNLPWISNQLTKLQNKKLKRGLFRKNNKILYVNRGLGSHPKFRFLTPPEQLLITLI